MLVILLAKGKELKLFHKKSEFFYIKSRKFKKCPEPYKLVNARYFIDVSGSTNMCLHDSTNLYSQLLSNFENDSSKTAYIF